MRPKHSAGMRALVMAAALICSVLVAPSGVIRVGDAADGPSDTTDGKAAKLALRSYVIANHGRLEFLVETTWKDKVAQPPDDLPPTITFTPHRGSAWEVLITALWSPDGRDWSKQRRAVREMVLDSAARALPEAVETEAKLQEISGDGLFGYLTYPLTDEGLVATEPEPGDYRYICQGSIGVRELLVVVTVLFQDKEDAVRDAVVGLLASAKQRT